MGQMEIGSNTKTVNPMKTILFLTITIAVLIIPTLASSQKNQDLYGDLISEQQEIISKLTGKLEIREGVSLKQRATPEERKITVDYLSKYLVDLGWALQNHKYKVTNGYPFLDLVLKPMQGINVTGILPATTSSNTYLIFGGHYDSERGSPGAIDNATGIALCLAVARKLKQLDQRKFNCMVVFFDQEEDDEVGSRAFAKMLKKTNKEIHSMHNIDMMGWDKDNNKGIELELPPPELEILYKNLAEEMKIPVYSANVGSSDHTSFIDQGFTAMGICEEYVKGDTTPYYHSSKDDYDTVNFEYLASSTHFIFQLFKSLLQ